jgi:outer membrane protein OmpA-like peptidoglycan-associated protein
MLLALTRVQTSDCIEHARHWRASAADRASPRSMPSRFPKPAPRPRRADGLSRSEPGRRRPDRSPISDFRAPRNSRSPSIANVGRPCDVGGMDGPAKSFRATVGIAATILLLTSTAAHACMPSNIEFRFGSARLDAAARAEVAYVAEEYRRMTSGRVRVLAQTDGSAANVRMARRRSLAVRTELLRRGVPARAIITETPGPSGSLIRGNNYARLVVFDIFSAPPGRATDSAGCS